MSYPALKARLDRGEIVILDGGTGTELQRRGAAMDPAAWCGPASLENQKLLTEIHADYIRAGAEVVTANTFASSRLMLEGAGLGDRVEEVNRIAVEAALRARDETPGAEKVVVAGSLSHMVPVGGGGDAVDPGRIPSHEEIADAFQELAAILSAAGCEVILLEMMYHPDRARLALAAALSTGLPVWFGLSAKRGAQGEVLAFDRLADYPLEEVVKLIPSDGVDAAGVMHTGAEIVGEALDIIRQRFGGPLTAYPDSGYFEMPDWRFVDVIEPAVLEGFFQDWIGRGARVIGGCCGLTIEHIQAAVRAREAVRAA